MVLDELLRENSYNLQQQKFINGLRQKNMALNQTHLQQQKFINGLRPFMREAGIMGIYNSRNLSMVLDILHVPCKLYVSTTVEIYQWSQTSILSDVYGISTTVEIYQWSQTDASINSIDFDLQQQKFINGLRPGRPSVCSTLSTTVEIYQWSQTG